MLVLTLPHLLLAGLTLVSATGVFAQSTITRCEGADGSIGYSNAECPPGTRAMRPVAPAAQPSAQAQKEARERVQREKDVAQSLAAPRQPTSAQASPGQAYVPIEEARRAADCAYLRAELESNRRLRNVLTTRRYYSTEDVEQMDAREAGLAADYRRFCTR
ncbi:MAG: hypothetical protein ACXWVT_10055 [Burkholderiaceae bacterium]